MEKALES